MESDGEWSEVEILSGRWPKIGRCSKVSCPWCHRKIIPACRSLGQVLPDTSDVMQLGHPKFLSCFGYCLLDRFSFKFRPRTWLYRKPTSSKIMVLECSCPQRRLACSDCCCADLTPALRYSAFHTTVNSVICIVGTIHSAIVLEIWGLCGHTSYV